MARVDVIRRRNQYRRTVNGAWVYNGTDVSQMNTDEENLRPQMLPSGYVSHFSVGDGIMVRWPDGVEEHAFDSHGGHGAHRRCIPENGRLSKLLSSEPRASGQ